MRRAAIVSPVRTPVGMFGGALRSVPVETLGMIVLEAPLNRLDRGRERSQPERRFGHISGMIETAEGIGPVPANAKLMNKTGHTLAQMDLIEVNEAFAAQVLSVLKAREYTDTDKVNVNGSGISLGHPFGATGVRMMVTLLHEMKRGKARLGLETMCVGGGQGLAAIFESA